MRVTDISSNNHGSKPLFISDLKAAGYTGVYIKLGEGTAVPGGGMYVNPYANGDFADAVNAGLDIGFYWFYNHSFSVAAQAAKFNLLIAQYRSRMTMRPMFDYEVGIPTVNIRDQFLAAVPNCGQYSDQDFYATLGYVPGTWLAIPGWNGQATSADMVQVGQAAIEGLPNGLSDVNEVLVPRNILLPQGAIKMNPDPLDLPLTSATGRNLNAPAVGMKLTSTGKGYWIAFADGGVDSFGDAKFYGSLGATPLNRPIVGIDAHDDNGYLLVAEDGGVFAFGDGAWEGTA
jgi:hypothetical protein